MISEGQSLFHNVENVVPFFLNTSIISNENFITRTSTDQKYRVNLIIEISYLNIYIKVKLVNIKNDWP